MRIRPVWDHDEDPVADLGAARAVLYVGVAGSGAVGLWDSLHAANPDLWLLGSDGVARQWFARGMSPAAAARTRFFVAQRVPMAFYGYEAMALVLDAIAAGDGDRAATARAARATRDRDSVLGRYSVDAEGHTTSTAYGRLAVVDGALVWDVRRAVAPLDLRDVDRTTNATVAGASNAEEPAHEAASASAASSKDGRSPHGPQDVQDQRRLATAAVRRTRWSGPRERTPGGRHVRLSDEELVYALVTARHVFERRALAATHAAGSAETRAVREGVESIALEDVRPGGSVLAQLAFVVQVTGSAVAVVAGLAPAVMAAAAEALESVYRQPVAVSAVRERGGGADTTATAAPRSGWDKRGADPGRDRHRRRGHRLRHLHWRGDGLRAAPCLRLPRCARARDLPEPGPHRHRRADAGPRGSLGARRGDRAGPAVCGYQGQPAHHRRGTGRSARGIRKA